MADRTIDGETAWALAAAQPGRRWAKGLDRFAAHPVTVTLDPKFMVAPEDKVFCIGSCFARNIETQLIYNHVDVLSRRIVSPAAEFGKRPSGIVNKFTTASMANEVGWIGQSAAQSDARFCAVDAETVVDLQLAPGSRPVTPARAIERRDYLQTDYFARMADAGLVILTLGLDEVWRDGETGLFLNATPPRPAVLRAPGRYCVEVLGYEANLAALETLRTALRAKNPAVRFLVTVSPVPLDLSFTHPDVLVATARGKAMLRTVAQAFVDAHDDADYFPAYEMITWSPRDRTFEADCRHVDGSAVGVVIGRFLKAYLGREPEPTDFREGPYLQANPDVMALVRAGLIDSGFAHWTRHGRAEGRPLG